MSVNGNYEGNVELPEHTVLSSTSTTTLGTVAANMTRTLASFSFANTSAGSITCRLIRNDGTTDYTVWVGAVAANDAKVVDNLPLRLRSGDSIKAVGNTGVTVTLVYMAAYPFAGVGA